MTREELQERTLEFSLFIQRAGLARDRRPTADALLDEAHQLTRIFVSAYCTSRDRRDQD